MAIKKVLILAANPLETARFRLEKEVEEIRVTLERSPNRDNFAIESRGWVRLQDLQTHLYHVKPQILHFSGHGGGEWGLAFEAEDGAVKAVSTESLADLFKVFANQIQCVVLNACHAVVQAEAICQHIPYAIVMNQAIGDIAARKFAEGFYKAIWDDRSIEDAFASGVNAIALEGIPEELTPVLLKRKLLKRKLSIMSVVQVIPIYSSIRKTARYFVETLPYDVPLEMVEIPAGKFMMGASDHEQDLNSVTNSRPQHEVTLHTFCMGKYSITQEQWRVVTTLPKVKTALEPDPSNFKGDKRPVENVSWLDAMEFCRRLSVHTKREYRLPSEAEWEYACRAGTTTPFHFGETITTDYVNYDGNNPYADALKGEYRQQTTDVGSFKAANAFGLYDMHGNVWEWCADDWHDSYKEAPKDSQIWIKDNKNYEDPESRKLLRGGSWGNGAQNCRSAYRDFDYALSQRSVNGFRVVSVVR